MTLDKFATTTVSWTRNSTLNQTTLRNYKKAERDEISRMRKRNMQKNDENRNGQEKVVSDAEDRPFSNQNISRLSKRINLNDELRRVHTPADPKTPIAPPLSSRNYNITNE